MSKGDDLGERVLAARGRSVVPPPPEAGGGGHGRSIGWGAVAVIAATAVVVLVMLHRGSAPPEGSGVASVSQRREVALGVRGAAVLEAGAEIEWRAGASVVSVEQRKGDVFYRADRGARFTVKTPVGAIEATDPACFRVRLTEGGAELIVEQGVVSGAGKQVSAGEHLRLHGG